MSSPVTQTVRDAPAPLLGTLTFLAAGIGVPAIVISATGPDPLPDWTLALTSVVISAARFAWIVGSRQRRLFEMTTWLFFYTFLGMAPLVQLRMQANPPTTPNLFHELDGVAMTIVIVSQLALIIGSALASRRAADERPPRRQLSWTRTRNYSAVLMVGTFAYIAAVGPASLFSARSDRVGAVSSVISDSTLRPIVAALVTMGLLVAVVAQLQVRRERKQMGVKRPLLLLALSMIALLIVVNPFGSPRYVMGTVLLSLIAAFGVYRSMRAYRTVALSALAAIIVLFPALDAFRRTLDTTITIGNPLDSLVQGDFDGYGQTLNTALYVANEGIVWGNQMLGVILFWVPRAIWPEKANDTGVFLAEYRDYAFTNLSAPLPAELYINGSWPLVIIGMAILGYMLRRGDARSNSRVLEFGVPTVLGCVLPFFMIILLRGSLLQATANLAVILVSWFLVSERRRDLPPEAKPRGRSQARYAGV